MNGTPLQEHSTIENAGDAFGGHGRFRREVKFGLRDPRSGSGATRLTLLGVIRISGVEGTVTVTVTDCSDVPPFPVQLRVNTVVVLSAPVDSEPAVGRLPFQPPDAVQEVASVDDHVSSELSPMFTVVGLAVNVIVGGGGKPEQLVWVRLSV